MTCQVVSLNLLIYGVTLLFEIHTKRKGQYLFAPVSEPGNMLSYCVVSSYYVNEVYKVYRLKAAK